MAKTQKNNALDFKIEIGHTENKEWSAEKLSGVKDFIKQETEKRTDQQKRRTELLSIRYKMEEYIENNELNSSTIHTIDTFLSAYLGTLNLSFKKFAIHIDTTDGNLKKYLTGQRKFNIDLAMKFGHFFHTPPDLWLKIQIKNELIELNKEKKQVSRYKKYDYEKILA
jgi:plasmid maintenance system antidote protein VapI